MGVCVGGRWQEVPDLLGNSVTFCFILNCKGKPGRYSSVVEHLPALCEALGSASVQDRKKNQGNKVRVQFLLEGNEGGHLGLASTWASLSWLSLRAPFPDLMFMPSPG